MKYFIAKALSALIIAAMILLPQSISFAIAIADIVKIGNSAVVYTSSAPNAKGKGTVTAGSTYKIYDIDNNNYKILVDLDRSEYGWITDAAQLTKLSDAEAKKFLGYEKLYGDAVALHSKKDYAGCKAILLQIKSGYEPANKLYQTIEKRENYISAVKLYENKRYEECIAKLKGIDNNAAKSLREYAKKGIAAKHLAVAEDLIVTNDFASALKEYNRAIALDGKNFEALIGKINCLYDLKKYSEALEEIGAIAGGFPNKDELTALSNKIREKIGQADEEGNGKD